MATNKEGTLQINRFFGINITEDSPINNPGLFFNSQNMYPVEEGELRNVGGVTARLAASPQLPGVQSIERADYWEHPNGAHGLVGLYKLDPAIASMPAPSGMVFTIQGAPTTTRNVRTVFVGPGGVENNTNTAAVPFGSGGVSVTLPTNVPDYVFCVHFYVEMTTGPSAGCFIWSGTLSRRNNGATNGFAASIILFEPEASGAVANTIYESQPTRMDVTTSSTAGGKLVGGRRYYLGVTPWMGKAGNIVSFTDASSRQLVVDLPPNHNTILVNFSGLPAQTGDVTPVTYSYIVLFIGISASDMLPVGDFTDGRVRPIPKTSIAFPTNFTISELSCNSNIRSDDAIVTSSGISYNTTPTRPAGFTYGSTVLSRFAFFTPSADQVAHVTGAFLIHQDLFDGIGGTWSALNRVELLPIIDITNYDITAPNILGGLSANQSYLINDTVSQSEFQTTMFTGRLFITNGYNVPWFVSGTVIKPLTKSSTSDNIPITTLCIATRSRLCLGGGSSNYTYDPGFIWVSDDALPWGFGSGSSNDLLIGFNDSSSIIGFGIYSENLSQAGPQSYLVIGKESSIFTWNGSLTSASIQQIDKRIGFASPNCFVNTVFGPIFVGRDNVYTMRTANQIMPVNYDIDSLIKGFTPAQLAGVTTTWHENHVKIGYEVDDPGDTELWYKMQLKDGELQTAFSGAHKMFAYLGQLIMPKFGTETNLRISYDAGTVYQRDMTANAENDGQDQERILVISRLSMGQDHFRKVMTRIYAAVKLVANEDFDFTFEFEDGTTPAVTISGSVLLADGARQLSQFFTEDRILGRIVKLTIENTSPNNLSIFDISMLFDTKRRRRMT